MPARTSAVNTLKANSISMGSILEIGDSKRVTPVGKVFALQREYPIFPKDDPILNQEPDIFKVPLLEAHIYEPIHTNIVNEDPLIKVNHMKITGVSTASVIEIGSTDYVYSEARVKNIRQFFNPPDQRS
ncbi:spore germination protein PE [Scopulibacillus daqui]|uniref:Spore germination protein PE n=1 Tax=Scopulibacillus daqui TaxID=1469162 RepID=A0ABS2Q137_9BACL|nr:spore germination protein GerPE [Scopulibacillus daqui]MBM7645247.1 spore germination protein PE [Scopulibacillus daqui]